MAGILAMRERGPQESLQSVGNVPGRSDSSMLTAIARSGSLALK